MPADEMPDLTDPQVLHQIFSGFAQELNQIVEGQQKLIAMTNYLSGESLALAAILAAMRKKTGVTVTAEEAMDSLMPLLRPETRGHEDAVRQAVSGEIDRLLADG
jgi:hypothetical protein